MTIENRYIELINNWAFHIHEVHNGSKWDHYKWMNDIFFVLEEEYNEGVNRSSISDIICAVGPITTPLNDIFEVKRTEDVFLQKYINGKFSI